MIALKIFLCFCARKLSYLYLCRDFVCLDALYFTVYHKLHVSGYMNVFLDVFVVDVVAAAVSRNELKKKQTKNGTIKFLEHKTNTISLLPLISLESNQIADTSVTHYVLQLSISNYSWLIAKVAIHNDMAK